MNSDFYYFSWENKDSRRIQDLLWMFLEFLVPTLLTSYMVIFNIFVVISTKNIKLSLLFHINSWNYYINFFQRTCATKIPKNLCITTLHWNFQSPCRGSWSKTHYSHSYQSPNSQWGTLTEINNTRINCKQSNKLITFLITVAKIIIYSRHSYSYLCSYHFCCNIHYKFWIVLVLQFKLFLKKN